MKAYQFVLGMIVVFLSCQKEDNKFDKQKISIANQSTINWESVRVYSVVRNACTDSLLILNSNQKNDTVVVWNKIHTDSEDAWFDFKVTMSDKRRFTGIGGQRSDLPYSKITSNIDLTIYSDSIKINSY